MLFSIPNITLALIKKEQKLCCLWLYMEFLFLPLKAIFFKKTCKNIMKLHGSKLDEIRAYIPASISNNANSGWGLWQILSNEFEIFCKFLSQTTVLLGCWVPVTAFWPFLILSLNYWYFLLQCCLLCKGPFALSFEHNTLKSRLLMCSNSAYGVALQWWVLLGLMLLSELEVLYNLCCFSLMVDRRQDFLLVCLQAIYGQWWWIQAVV